MRAIIVDDEIDAIEVLTDVLSECCPEVEIVATATSVEVALGVIVQHDPELVFLDIQMPRSSGFELLKLMPSARFRTIFVSAHENFAIEAVKFQAMAYLLKPVSSEALEEALALTRAVIKKDAPVDYQSLVQSFEALTSKRIAIPTSTGHRYLDLAEIVRVEAAKNYSNIYTQDVAKPILVSRNLKQFEVLLSKRGFIRVHNAHLVNAQHIEEHSRVDGGSVLLSDGFKVLVGRNYRQGLLDHLRLHSEAL